MHLGAIKDLCIEINIPNTIFDGERVNSGKALP